MVGLWGTSDEGAYMERLHKAFDVEVVTSVTQAVAFVERLGVESRETVQRA